MNVHGPKNCSYEDKLSWLGEQTILLIHSGGYASRNDSPSDFVELMEVPTVFDVKMSLLAPISNNIKEMMSEFRPHNKLNGGGER